VSRPLPVQDLEVRLQLGLARGRALCTDEELRLVATLLTLEEDEALAVARLTGRKGEVFRLPDLQIPGLVRPVTEVIEGLRAQGLLVEQVPWALRAAAAPRAVLAAGCRRLGLSVGGRRAELQARLQDLEGWDEAAWVQLTVEALVLRLERWATLEVWPDRSVPVLERMGRAHWPAYAPSGGGLVPDRQSWLRWEGLVGRLDALQIEEAWQALAWPHWPPGRLDLRRGLERWLAEQARALEQRGELAQAEAIHVGLLDRDGTRGTWWVRRARCRELGGDVPGALELLQLGRESTRGAERLEVLRAGRRVARQLGRGWAPDPPLLEPHGRDIALARVGMAGPRPLYEGASGPALVEEAVSSWVLAAGRRVLPGEHGIWRTLVGLLLADLAWLPVPDQLPVSHLSGPLDQWTPQFGPRRAEAVFTRLSEIAAGAGPALIEAAWERHHGQRCLGIDWALATCAELVALACGLGAGALNGIVRVVLAQGRRAFSGLPDLVVLPGEVVRVDRLWPGTLSGGVVLIEVKGEADGVRDEQRWWFHHFVRSGVRAELWRVRAPAARG
jgi:hypothetical protein